MRGRGWEVKASAGAVPDAPDRKPIAAMSTGPPKRITSTGVRSLARAAQYVLLKPSMANVGEWPAIALVAVTAVACTGA